MARLAALHFGRSDSLIWHAPRGSGLHDFLQDVSEQASSSVYSLTPQAGPQQPMSRGAVWASRVVRRGLRSRTVLGSARDFSPAERDYYEWLSHEGAQVRWTSKPIERLFLVDGQLAMIKQDPAAEVSAPLVVVQPSVVAALNATFELAWSSSRPISDGFDGRSEDRDRDFELLSLLESGLTDESIARRLGISTRQLGRRVAALSDQLGAVGRVGLGAAAARSGWL